MVMEHDLHQITRPETELQEEIKKAYWHYDQLKKNDLR